MRRMKHIEFKRGQSVFVVVCDGDQYDVKTGEYVFEHTLPSRLSYSPPISTGKHRVEIDGEQVLVEERNIHWSIERAQANATSRNDCFRPKTIDPLAEFEKKIMETRDQTLSPTRFGSIKKRTEGFLHVLIQMAPKIRQNQDVVGLAKAGIERTSETLRKRMTLDRYAREHLQGCREAYEFIFDNFGGKS